MSGFKTAIMCHSRPAQRWLHICPHCNDHIGDIDGVSVHDVEKCALLRANKEELSKKEYLDVLHAYDPMAEMKKLKNKKLK